MPQTCVHKFILDELENEWCLLVHSQAIPFAALATERASVLGASVWRIGSASSAAFQVGWACAPNMKAVCLNPPFPLLPLGLQSLSSMWCPLFHLAVRWQHPPLTTTHLHVEFEVPDVHVIIPQTAWSLSRHLRWKVTSLTVLFCGSRGPQLSLI